MAGLDAFQTGATNSISDFQDNTQLAPPVTNASSNQNMAAHAALLSPRADQVTPVFNQSLDELNQSGTSDTMNTVVANAVSQNTASYQRASMDLLTDPNASDEWKKNALTQINSPDSDLYRVRAMVGTQAAVKTVPDETSEASDLRGVWAVGINKVLDFQRDKQKMYNEMQVRQKASSDYTGAVDLAESLIPGVSGYKSASTASDIVGGGAVSKIWGTILPGEAKQVMVDKFNSIPFEQRKAAMDKAMDVISQHGSTILLPEEKDQANMSIFRDAVESGNYTMTDRVVDNVLGVLDMTGLLGVLRTATKAGKAANAAEDLVGGGGSAAETATTARRPTQEADWRTGEVNQPGTFDQNGNPSSAVAPVSNSKEVGPVNAAPTDADRLNWHRQFIISDVQPASPSQVIKDANPTMARNLHEAVEQDPTGSIASATYGTSRQDAIASDIAPQVASVDGSVVSKVSNPEKAGDFRMMPDADVLDFVDNSGAAWLTPSEKRVLSANAKNDFLNAVGMTPRKEMSSVDTLDDGVKFSSVYGPSDSGWSSLKAATDQAQFALKDYGITSDNISILARDGDTYKAFPMNSIDITKDLPGDYLLKVEHNYKFNSADLERDGYEALDVKNNFIDRWFPGGGDKGGGTVQSGLLDPQSMLNPKLTKGATIGGLRGAQTELKMMQIVKPYIETMKGIAAPRQQAVFQKIREANLRGESFNYANLKAEGFAAEEVTALEHWKRAQDTLYHITNRDLVKTYQHRGFGMMEHEASGTRLLVKDVKKGDVPNDTLVYDPLTDSVKKMSTKEIADHYAKEGTIARVGSTINVGGQEVEHVLNMNKAGSTYIRNLKHTDTVMNYRPGYYAVRYTDPHFIEKQVLNDAGKPMVDASGNEVWRAIATAANIPDAEKAMARLHATTTGSYRRRGNLKGEDFDKAEGQRLQAGGLSSQRLRGNRLEDSLGDNDVSKAQHLESPINSLIHSVASISNRVSMRDYLETAKSRFLSQFEEVLPKKKGVTQYPSTRGEIGLPGSKTSKMAGDARTTWEYIRQLENGYVNAIDDGWKAMFNGVANIFGVKGFGTTESALRKVGAFGPSAVARRVAFDLLIVANPIRQFIIQSHQVMMLGANFPAYTFAHMADDITLMATYALGGKPSEALLKFSSRTEKEAQAMWDALSKSGISAGISKHELVRQSLMSIADEANVARSRVNPGLLQKAVTKPVGGLFNTMRKVGFDAGEWVSSSAAFLAHYDKALKDGVKISQSAIDDITTQSRNYVYNMDKAGAIAWSKNTASLITQFLEQPYKAVLQMTTNRGISGGNKFLLGSFMVGMYGTHSLTGIAPAVDSVVETYLNQLLPEDKIWRDAIVRGVESLALNSLFTKIYGEKVELDYSSISPLDSYGLFEFMNNISSEGIGQIIASSPSGSLLFGNNPRITNLAKTTVQLMGFGDNKYSGDPVGWSNLAKDAAAVFSGSSNAMKAAYALEYGRKIGALGGTLDSRVNSFEAIAQALGIPTMDEKKTNEIMDATFKNKKQLEDEVTKVFNQTVRHLTQDGITPDQFQYYVAMSNLQMSAFKGEPAATEQWNKLMRKQILNKDYALANSILQQCGFMSKADTIKLINKVPNITEEQRQNLIAVCDFNSPKGK